MAMFLESTYEVKPLSSLELLEEFLESVIEYGDYVEQIIQEEYTILTEEGENPAKEEKKKGLLAKFKGLLLKTYDKFLNLVKNVKKKILSIVKTKANAKSSDSSKNATDSVDVSPAETSKSTDSGLKMYKTHYDYLVFVYNSMQSVVSETTTEQEVNEWKSKVWALQNNLVEDNPIPVDKVSIDKMIDAVDKLEATVSSQIEKLKADSSNVNSSIPKNLQKVFLTLYHTLDVMKKAFPKK